MGLGGSQMSQSVHRRALALSVMLHSSVTAPPLCCLQPRPWPAGWMRRSCQAPQRRWRSPLLRPLGCAVPSPASARLLQQLLPHQLLRQHLGLQQVR